MSGLHIASLYSGLPNSEISIEADDKFGDFEGRCVKRKEVLETLLDALPPGTVRYSSKVVSIEELGRFKLLYLADGSTPKTKVLVGCDGINAGVAQYLGLQSPVYAGRSAIGDWLSFQMAMALNPSTTCILEAAFAMLIFHVMRRACIGFAPSFFQLSIMIKAWKKTQPKLSNLF